MKTLSVIHSFFLTALFFTLPFLSTPGVFAQYGGLENPGANIALNAFPEWGRLDLTGGEPGNYSLTLYNTSTNNSSDNIQIQIADVSKNIHMLDAAQVESALTGAANVAQDRFSGLDFSEFRREIYNTGNKNFILLSALHSDGRTQVLWAGTITGGYYLHVETYVNIAAQKDTYDRRAANFRLILDTIRPLQAR